jgi:hypothetical protein
MERGFDDARRGGAGVRGRAVAAAAAAIVLGGARAARGADVVPPPTLLIDFLWLGFPLGIIAGIALIGGVVALFIRLRRRGRTRLRAGVLSALAFFAGNLTLYIIWINFLWKSARERYFEEREEGAPPVAEVAADAGSDATTRP